MPFTEIKNDETLPAYGIIQTQEEDPATDERRTDIADIVSRCGKGDPAAIRDFFNIHAADIYNFPIKVFHLDEDAASEFFLYAYERLRDGARFRSYQGKSSFRTWFYTVLRNLVIDWIRTVKDIKTVDIQRVDSSGQEYFSVENTADPRSQADLYDDTLTAAFRNAIDKLSAEHRIVFKLSFIYYLDLESDEISYIASKTGISQSEVIKKIARLRDLLSEKELKNLSYEDKIASLYKSIMDLKNRKEKLLSEEHRQRALRGLEYELDQIEKAIRKKYSQRDRLLEKKEKGHFIARTPYKYIAELLGMTESSVSVQMMRATEKIRSFVMES